MCIMCCILSTKSTNLLFVCIHRNNSEVSISYKVASCNNNENEKKSHTTPYIHYIKGDVIDIDGELIIDDPVLNINQCQIWKSQTIEQNITSVTNDCRFNVLIRNKMAYADQYLYIYSF